MTMSRFRQAPRVGHLQQVKRIFGYLGNLPHGPIRYRTHEPDYSDLPHKKYDWERTVYTSSREELPHDLPKQLGKQVTSTHYVDTNLHHDLVTGSSSHSMYPQCNSSSLALQETIDCGHSNFWFRFLAAMTAVDQIINLHLTLMYLGVPINPKSYMFGNNKPVATNA